MTNPTSNFGWQMPTSTDLVTDLPADFAVFGQAVDTSMADLKGGTTGQILAKATNTDMDFTWITNDIGDITAVNTTAPLQGGATSGAVSLTIDSGSTTVVGAVQLEDSTASTSITKAATPNSVKSAYDLANGAIAKTTVTTAGDIIYRNATVPTRLGIGTASQVLAVNSGATAPEWVTPVTGGMTLLSTTTLSGALTTVSGIPSTYKSLKIIGYNFLNNTSAGVLRIEVNGQSNSGYVGISGTATVNRINDYIRPDQTWERTDNDNGFTLDIDNYTSAASPFAHPMSFRGFFKAAGNVWTSFNLAGAAYTSTAPISSVGFIQTGGTWTSGTVLVYGVK